MTGCVGIGVNKFYDWKQLVAYAEKRNPSARLEKKHAPKQPEPFPSQTR